MRRLFSKAEIDRLKTDYRQYVENGRLSELASEMGRSKSVLAEKARKLGLTDAAAARRASAKKAGDSRRGKPLAWPHPKGFAGRRHSPEARRKCKDASDAYWASVPQEVRDQQSTRCALSASKRNAEGLRPHASWRAGWREIGGKRNYYRSRWEANYARYLEWLKRLGEIKDWQHEPETFWFDGIKRGVRSYRPDFRVWENDGSSALHEVKGWMDARSKTTLKRMAKYHPQEKLIVIRERDYNSIAKKVGRLIEGWEHSERAGR